MRRFVPLLFILSNCTVWKPVMLEPMSQPINGPYKELERKKVSDCDFVLFQVMKFGNGQRMEGLYKAVKGDADALIAVTLDKKVSNYWLWGVECYTMYGTPVELTAQ